MAVNGGGSAARTSGCRVAGRHRYSHAAADGKTSEPSASGVWSHGEADIQRRLQLVWCKLNDRSLLTLQLWYVVVYGHYILIYHLYDPYISLYVIICHHG